SSLRIDPPCPYFQHCGGCPYQHTTYEHQLGVKAQNLKEKLRRIAKLQLPSEPPIHSSLPWHYRNRTRLQVRADSAFALGYFKMSSHELLPIEQCPISSPLINRALGALWQLGHAGQVPSTLREIELFCDAQDSRLQVELYVNPGADKGRRTAAAQAFAEQLHKSLPEVENVYVFAQNTVSTRALPVATSQELDWANVSRD